jgi:polyhydroxyalkanoate synthesis regulator phasin
MESEVNKMKYARSKQVSQAMVNYVTRFASKREVLIGIDPRSTLGQDILRQNAEVAALRNEVQELKKMVADLSNHLKEKGL